MKLILVNLKNIVYKKKNVNNEKGEHRMTDTQKSLMAEYAETIEPYFYKEDGTFDSKYYDYYIKRAYIITRLTDGTLFLIEDPGISKDFCFDDSYDFDGAVEMARHARNSPEYFKEQNMKCFQAQIEMFTNPPHYVEIHRERHYISDHITMIYAKNINYLYGEEINKVSQEDIDIVIEAYRQALKKHEIRIDRYLKRYGTKHVHSWTYWGER